MNGSSRLIEPARARSPACSVPSMVVRIILWTLALSPPRSSTSSECAPGMTANLCEHVGLPPRPNQHRSLQELGGCVTFRGLSKLRARGSGPQPADTRRVYQVSGPEHHCLD